MVQSSLASAIKPQIQQWRSKHGSLDLPESSRLGGGDSLMEDTRPGLISSRT